MATDPLTFAQEALGCARTPRRSVEPLGYCRTHDSCHWPCPEAVRVAALIEARDREVRADAQAAALDEVAEEISVPLVLGNGFRLVGSDWLHDRAKALRERATQHRTEETSHD